MISDALIIPTESHIRIDDLKRALISFDKVYLPSPDDREVIPPNTLMKARFASLGIDFPLPFAFSQGPVRPLGKVPGYDESFEKLIGETASLFKEGKIEILGTPQYTNSLTIGATPVPSDTPHPIFTYVNYRSLTQDQNFVNLVAGGLEKIDLKKIADVTKLAPSGMEDRRLAVGGVMQIEQAALQADGHDADGIKILSRMAHARLGALVKSIGFCHNKKIVPFTTDVGLAKVISQLEYQFVGNINALPDESTFIKQQKQLNTFQNFVLEEYIDPDKLNSLSPEQIVKLRTKAWGKHHKAKQRFVELLTEIGLSSENEDKFKTECRAVLDEYMKLSADYRNELGDLGFSLQWKLIAATMLNTAGREVIERAITAPSLEALLTLGAIPVALVMTDAVRVKNFLQKAIDARQSSGYVIYNQYKYLM